MTGKAGRRLKDEELKLHQAALAGQNHEITIKQAESIVPDSKTRQNALNFLLGIGFFKSLKDAKGNLSFKAVTKGELEQTKDLSADETLVLGQIKSAHNEGIWIKHLKNKTNLHQTVVERCLKTLIQKKLIKRVQSVQHPMQKIYMLEGVEPAVALTGGPWYTDNELDTVFIETISKACLKFIRDVSFPPQRKTGNENALFPISNAPQYPSAAQIHKSLRQARLTETDLSVEHISMLLEVLVLDGEIEKIPSFGNTLWDSSAIPDEASDASDDEGSLGSKKKKKTKVKRRRTDSSEEDEIQEKKSRKKKRRDDTESDHSDIAVSRRKKNGSRRRAADDSDTESDSAPKKRKKPDVLAEDSENDEKRRKKSRGDSEASESSDEEERQSRKKKKRMKESSDENSEDEGERRRRKKSRSVKRSPSPFESQLFDDQFSAAMVYRAIRPERVSLGWSEAPCSKCASFDFCRQGGPVNAGECVYYGDWLVAGTLAFDDEMEF